MTNNQLEVCLIQTIEELSGRILLTGTKGERKKLKGYPGTLPQLSLLCGKNHRGGNERGCR